MHIECPLIALAIWQSIAQKILLPVPLLAITLSPMCDNIVDNIMTNGQVCESAQFRPMKTCCARRRPFCRSLDDNRLLSGCITVAWRAMMLMMRTRWEVHSIGRVIERGVGWDGGGEAPSYASARNDAVYTNSKSKLAKCGISGARCCRRCRHRRRRRQFVYHKTHLLAASSNRGAYRKASTWCIYRKRSAAYRESENPEYGSDNRRRHYRCDDATTAFSWWWFSSGFQIDSACVPPGRGTTTTTTTRPSCGHSGCV